MGPLSSVMPTSSHDMDKASDSDVLKPPVKDAGAFPCQHACRACSGRAN